MRKISTSIMFTLLCFSMLPILAPQWRADAYISQLPQPSIVLYQNFDNETAGQIPKNWNIIQTRYGNFTVDGTVYYGKHGKSAKIVDKSIEGSPLPYRNFTEQRGTIVVTFAVRLTNNTGNNTNLEIYIDDGNFAGSNIIFTNNGTIEYRERSGQLVCLRKSYLPNRWYRIKMIMNIQDKVYNIHVDDHLEIIGANFTSLCDNIHRIIIRDVSPFWQPRGYIDDIEIRRCIEVPEDFVTIQEGVDAANPEDVIFVAKERTYYENVIIGKDVWLIGENMSTTVIDGRFIKTTNRESNGISIICNNVTIYGFTIKNSEANGIYMEGTNNTVINNIITSSLKCGISINGSKLAVISNIIESNYGCGIRIVAGEDNSIRRNIIRDNEVGLKGDVGTEDNIIYQNRFICNTFQALDYGLNIWHDGYPYEPLEEKGGGNYWGNHVCVDLYSGVNQDEHGPICSPLPDGICDKPYIIDAESTDSYPLFLIQSITQKPENTSLITYETKVNVTATVLNDVQIEEAKIYVYFDSKYDGISMKISADQLTGTIPLKPYGTKVRYNVSVRAYCAASLSSTDYPLPSQYYYVRDLKPPVISKIDWSPKNPNETAPISVSATVVEPINASQVDKVFLSYSVSGSTWKTEMKATATKDNYVATMPKQPAGRLSFVIEALDRAGNRAEKSGGTDVRRLAELSVEYKNKESDPCDIDFAVMSKDEKKEGTFRIHNKGQELLTWEIIVVEPTPWFTLNITKGTTPSSKYTIVKITINTTGYSDPLPCVGEFSIKANGKVHEWTIIARATVMHIVIVESYTSSGAPDRCDIGSTQNYAFHAIWAHNSSDAINGNITVTEIGVRSVNLSGWASFTYSSPNAVQKTFKVENVRFPCVYQGTIYYITSFTHKAPFLTTTWENPFEMPPILAVLPLILSAVIGLCTTIALLVWIFGKRTNKT